MSFDNNSVDPVTIQWADNARTTHGRSQSINLYPEVVIAETINAPGMTHKDHRVVIPKSNYYGQVSSGFFGLNEDREKYNKYPLADFVPDSQTYTHNFITGHHDFARSPDSFRDSADSTSYPTSPSADLNQQAIPQQLRSTKSHSLNYIEGPMNPVSLTHKAAYTSYNNIRNSQDLSPYSKRRAFSLSNPSEHRESSPNAIDKSKRSRMGCLTCRQRKKRCCESRPRCYECGRLGLKCVWPTPGLEHRNKPRHIRVNENVHFHHYFGNIQIIRGIVENK